MMKRLIGVFAGFALASPALACDLTPLNRPTVAADYVPLAEDCLNQLPEGSAIERDMESRFADLVNEERAKVGLPPLRLRPALRQPARFHSLDMAANNFFSHVGPDARSVSDRIALLDRGLVSRAQGENLALGEGFPPTEDVVALLHRGLMDSEGHRNNILNPKWTHFAIGIVRVGDRVAVTQIFVIESGEISPPPPALVRRGERLSFNLRLNDWSPHKIVLRLMGDGEMESDLGLAGTQIPTDIFGDTRMMIQGVQPGDRPNVQRLLNFSGPAVTIR